MSWRSHEHFRGFERCTATHLLAQVQGPESASGRSALGLLHLRDLLPRCHTFGYSSGPAMWGRTLAELMVGVASLESGLGLGGGVGRLVARDGGSGKAVGGRELW